MQRRMQRLIRFLLLAMILALGAVWAAAWFGRAPGESPGDAFLRHVAFLTGREVPPVSSGGVQLPQGLVLGGPFALVDQDGRAVTQDSYPGKLIVAYFGYSFCPDVCPTELGVIADAMDLLTPAEQARVQPTFITIDPARDTPEQIKAYVANFHPAMIGLTGSAEQIAAAARAFRVYYAKVERADMSVYLMDHSSMIYLIGPGGRARSLVRSPASPAELAAAIRGQLAGL